MPNRIIKESICRSDSINSLTWFEEALFYRLIVVCDDYGRFDGRPAIIKGTCFPLKDSVRREQIEDALNSLSTKNMIRRYNTEDGSYLMLTNWGKHQQTRAAKSKYPAPDDDAGIQNPAGLSKKKPSDIACNQMISNDIKCSRNRYTINDNRESYSVCDNARETDKVHRFEDFLAAYPKNYCNRYMTEHEYVSLLLTGKITENELVQCALNYAEWCRDQEKEDQWIKNAENFLKSFEFENYMPGKYARKDRPEKKNGTKNKFNNFDQRNYDYADLERKLLS